MLHMRLMHNCSTSVMISISLVGSCGVDGLWVATNSPLAKALWPHTVVWGLLALHSRCTIQLRGLLVHALVILGSIQVTHLASSCLLVLVKRLLLGLLTVIHGIIRHVGWLLPICRGRVHLGWLELIWAPSLLGKLHKLFQFLLSSCVLLSLRVLVHLIFS